LSVPASVVISGAIWADSAEASRPVLEPAQEVVCGPGLCMSPVKPKKGKVENARRASAATGRWAGSHSLRTTDNWIDQKRYIPQVTRLLVVWDALGAVMATV